jgi:hypothetical protein
MDKFLLLTDLYEKKAIVNIAEISTVSRIGRETTISFKNKNQCVVLETPEEIYQMMENMK